jgi:hypothetical protein
MGSLGGLIITPGDVDAEILRLAPKMTTLMGDVQGCANALPTDKTAFAAVYLDWTNFADSAMQSPLTGLMLTNPIFTAPLLMLAQDRMSKIAGFRTAAAEWGEKVIALGCSLSSPPEKAPPDPTEAFDINAAFRWSAFIAGAGAVVYLVHKFA